MRASIKFTPFRAGLITGFALFMGLAAVQQAAATPFIFELKSHPDGNAAPPVYGLRLDGIEWYATGNGGSSAAWTFNFDCALCDMVAVYDDQTLDFTISGTALGGRDAGSDYAGGGGLVEIDFTYQNVIANLDKGFPEFTLNGFAPGPAAAAGGSIVFTEANQSILAGTEVGLTGFANQGGLLFTFRADQHRLGGVCGGQDEPSFCALPVGRGWLALTGFSDNPYHTSSQDWLFVDPTMSIPEPTGLALLGAGLLGVAAARRRRNC